MYRLVMTFRCKQFSSSHTFTTRATQNLSLSHTPTHTKQMDGKIDEILLFCACFEYSLLKNFLSSLQPHMGLLPLFLVTFFSYDPLCLYPETYPDVSTTSTRPALPFPRPVLSKRSLCDPVNLVVSVRRLTVGEATARC